MKAVAVVPKTKNIASIADMSKPDFNFKRHAGAFGLDEDLNCRWFFRLRNSNGSYDLKR
jgi:hypothetical protein